MTPGMNFYCEQPLNGGTCDRLFGHKGEHRCAGDHENEGEGSAILPDSEHGSSPSAIEEQLLGGARKVRFWAWFLLVGLAFILAAMIGRMATAQPEPRPAPSPVESLIPAICIERDANGNVSPCKP